MYSHLWVIIASDTINIITINQQVIFLSKPEIYPHKVLLSFVINFFETIHYQLITYSNYDKMYALDSQLRDSTWIVLQYSKLI